MVDSGHQSTRIQIDVIISISGVFIEKHCTSQVHSLQISQKIDFVEHYQYVYMDTRTLFLGHL